MHFPYPDPPHLTIAIYPSGAEESAFTALCDVLHEAGCEPTGMVEVAPRDAQFVSTSDLVGFTELRYTQGREFRRVVSNESTSGRPVRAAYLGERREPYLVEYLQSSRGDKHPLAISCAAGSLGMPAWLWSKSDRRAAKKMAIWAAGILKAVCSACAPLYAGVGVEFTLPIPSALVAREAELSSVTYVSRAVLDVDPDVYGLLREDYGRVAEQDWGTGVFFAGWAPFSEDGTSMEGQPIRCSAAVGNAVLSLFHPR